MERDIIVIWNDMDASSITLNGIEVGYGIERGYEVGDILIKLFDKLNYNSKPLVVDIYDEDYDLSEGEREAFWERINNQFESKYTRFFTDDELQVLQETEDTEKFIEKIKENIKSYIKEEK